MQHSQGVHGILCHPSPETKLPQASTVLTLLPSHWVSQSLWYLAATLGPPPSRSPYGVITTAL